MSAALPFTLDRPLVFEGDTGPMSLIVYDVNTGAALDLTGSSALAGALIQPDGSRVDIGSNLALGTDPTTGEVVWTRQAGDLSQVGRNQIQISFTHPTMGDRSTAKVYFDTLSKL